MNIKMLIEAISLSALQCFLVHVSLAMNYYPQYSIPSAELIRISELSSDMELNKVYKAIDDCSDALNSTADQQEILRKLEDPLNKTVAFCQKVDQKDREHNESATVLLNLQMTRAIVLKMFFDLYKMAKGKIGINANTVITSNSDTKNKLVWLFGQI